MARQSSSNSVEQMNSYNQSDLDLSLLENHNVSFGNTENFADEPIGVYQTSHLRDAAIFIRSNGTCQNANIPRDSQHSVQSLNELFAYLATLKSTPQQFYRGLINVYAELYKIDLHVIALNTNNKYIIIGKDEVFDSNEVPIDQEKHAFIYCDLENDIYSPWFYRNSTNGENRTVFTKDDALIWRSIATRINRKNEENDTTQMQEDFSLPSNDLGNSVSENNLPPENHSMILDQQSSVRIEANVCMERMLQQLWHITQAATSLLSRTVLEVNMPELNTVHLNQSSFQEVNQMIQDRLLVISNVFQEISNTALSTNDNTIVPTIATGDNNEQTSTLHLGDTNNFEQANRNVSNVTPYSEPHLTNTTHIAQTASLPTPASFQYNAPPIEIQPKPDWHYRSMKDLGSPGFPIIAGDGPQRTPIRVQVPHQVHDKMYLGIKIVTYNHLKHLSKVLVPKGTTVDVRNFGKDNELNRLQFVQCNQADYFDPNNIYVYSGITADEHRAGRKDVKIYVFNLYQTGSINKDLIATGQLKKFKLAFWLNIFEDGVFKPISATSSSREIEEE
ncbi:unnamed protein product [Rotaria socialis]|uniref:Uncharacterized protein n=1 Tax=Rotaria socialis TaxID=392032 RepID=A0A818E9B2_9BILA|nr:unnamed protein product [Rotaria socialis]CAF4855192.1 unnamed protein product [Rotaria socialis]